MNKTTMTMLQEDELRSIIKSCLKEELEEYFKNEDVFKKSHNDMLSMKELCKILDVSKTTLIKWTREGKVIGRRIGRRIYYKPDDVEKSLKQYEITRLSNERIMLLKYENWKKR